MDTSAWIAFFRGSPPWADAVDEALADHEVALCGPVVTELRRGLRAPERDSVLALLHGCHFIQQPKQLWEDAGELGYLLRRKGATLKTMNLLITVHALDASIPILTADQDFHLMAKCGIPLQLMTA